MKVRRKGIVWAAAAAALLAIVLGSAWVARLRFAETEAELKSRLSADDLNALVTWGRGTALGPGAATTRWAAGDLPEPLRRMGVQWAATSTFAGDTFVFFHLHGENGKSGLLVAQTTAKWPTPPADWSQWGPGLWYHREQARDQAVVALPGAGAESAGGAAPEARSRVLAASAGERPSVVWAGMNVLAKVRAFLARGRPKPLDEWFFVTFDDRSVHLRAEPPGSPRPSRSPRAR